MRNSVPNPPRSYVERFVTDWRCFFIFLVQLMTVGAALAQNARTPPSDPATTSPYVVDGLALGARVDAGSPAYRGYQCSPSEQFPDFTRCQRTQKQQEGGTRRVFEATSSTLHGPDGKAVYINRHIAPWSFDRNEFQDEIKRLSSRFGERAREMRLPPREGVQTAIIAVWGKIQLTELDADAISILASGESPRKGLLIDYLGNLRRSAQQGLPIYSLNGGAGYIWSASVGRNNVGHIRVLAVDPSALSPAATASPAPAAEPAPGEVSKIETAAAEKPNAAVEPPPVEPENAGLDAGGATTEVQEAAAPEADKIAPLLARPEADLAAAEAKSRLMEKLAYWAVGGLIVLLMIVAPLLLLWRKRANATKAQVKSETQPARLAVRAQASQAQSTAPKSDLLEERSAVNAAAVSQDAAVADAILLQNRKKQKQDINDESGSQKQEAQLVAVNDKKDDGVQPPSADVIACAHCNREISKNDNFCMHCGASVAAEKRAAKTRLCSSCRQEIGTSDKFCRHCGASSLAVSAPGMTLNGNSASPDCARGVGHHVRVEGVVASTRPSVKRKRAPR
jgi:RNA polymerase subunit RPABC4/transcription elongation factor Spt4